MIECEHSHETRRKSSEINFTYLISVITLHSMIIALASFCDGMCTNHENNSTMNFEIYYVLFVMGYEKTSKHI